MRRNIFILVFIFLTLMLPSHQWAADKEILKFDKDDTLEEIRLKIEHNGYNFTVDHNWVYDMSPEEKAKFFSRRPTEHLKDALLSPGIGPLADQLGKKALPTKFDWRDYQGNSYIGAIRDQGGCGSCYSFGACAAAEGTYNYAMGRTGNNCIDFSESFIAWCLSTISPYDQHFYGCQGADYEYYELEALVKEGIIEESYFPYQEYAPASCTHWNDPRIVFDAWYRVPCNDIDAIKTAIMTYGVVDVAVYSNVGAFSSYSGGIYQDSYTDCENQCEYATTDHAVALVGWDDTEGVFILRNSWGTSWGENGYMRIKYTSAAVACAVCYMVYESAPSASISVTSPNGGESWNKSSSQTVQWSSTGSISNVAIDYSLDNGGIWSAVTSSTTNDGSHTWTLPNTTSSQCLIRVSDAADGTPSDTSDAVFSITAPTSDSLTVTAPNGGESLTGGSNYNIKWSSSGSISNVKLAYSTNSGSSWSTIESSTSNDGSYWWSVPSVTSSNCLVRVSDAADGSPSDNSNAVFSITAPTPATIYLSRDTLTFGALTSGIYTGSQNFSIDNQTSNSKAGGTLNWSITDDAQWLSCSPTSGTNFTNATVSIDPTGLAPGSYTGTITVSDPNSTNKSQTLTVKLTVKNPSAAQKPVGVIEIPENNANVFGSIIVSGWATDDIEIDRVEIHSDHGWIDNAVFVANARHDIEAKYPANGKNHIAGWGYQLLTNFLPNKGNGRYHISAIAYDKEGNEVLLGTTTIHCDNDNAVKPFGAIDTPTQGGPANGTGFLNWGWVLTPRPNSIPTDGSTVFIWIDGDPIDTIDYGSSRPDVTKRFPNYKNSALPGGVYSLDTTKYKNGRHEIFWTAADTAGNTSGIGSRYFYIENKSSQAPNSSDNPDSIMQRGLRESQEYQEPSNLGSALPVFSMPVSMQQINTISLNKTPVLVQQGFQRDAQFKLYSPDKSGFVNVALTHSDRVEIHLEGNRKRATAVSSGQYDASLSAYSSYVGYLKVGDSLRPLPLGSTLDQQKGTFSWHPGPGFHGNYDLVFVKKTIHGAVSKKLVRVSVGND